MSQEEEREVSSEHIGSHRWLSMAYSVHSLFYIRAMAEDIYTFSTADLFSVPRASLLSSPSPGPLCVPGEFLYIREDSFQI